MAKKKTVEKRLASEIAADLAVIRDKKAEITAEDKKVTQELLHALHDEQADRAGNYQISKVINLKVSVEELALPFALQRNAVKIDTAKIREILRHTFDEPEKYGFERVESERIVPFGRREEPEE